MSGHPEPPFTAPEMFGWEAKPSREWRTLPAETRKRCRRRLIGRVAADGSYRTCQEPAVAELDRGRRRPMWWAYCADHMYGRWIEEGVVVQWSLTMGEGAQP